MAKQREAFIDGRGTATSVNEKKADEDLRT